VRASGLPLETFLRERQFTPLGMKDTSFSVPAEKLDRFPAAYQADPETGKLHLDEEAGNGEWSEPPAFPDAGGGLVSTVDDCFAFGRMMLHKGKYDDERVLSRASVEAMTTDQLTPKQKAVSGFYPGNFDNRSWGFRACTSISGPRCTRPSTTEPGHSGLGRDPGTHRHRAVAPPCAALA
jgi:CubicO group peptidase (beta-lactamase class C family)